MLHEDAVSAGGVFHVDVADETSDFLPKADIVPSSGCVLVSWVLGTSIIMHRGSEVFGILLCFIYLYLAYFKRDYDHVIKAQME